jgi:Ni/Fe-hydrogenase subunit HybB-like protein
MRLWDLGRRGSLGRLRDSGLEPWLFTLEMCLLILPMLLLFREQVRRNPPALYACAVLAIFGFLTNRLNVSLAGMEAGSGVRYIPKWTEIAVTLAIVAAGFAIFRFAARHFAVFEEEALEPERRREWDVLAVSAAKGD